MFFTLVDSYEYDGEKQDRKKNGLLLSVFLFFGII